MSWAIAFAALLLVSGTGIPQIRSTIDLRGKNQQLNFYGSPGSVPVVLSNGDLGWAGFFVHVAELLSSKGHYVVGLKTKSYLASFTSSSGTLKLADVPYVGLL